MTYQIGILSDTHGYLSQAVKTFFMQCDEIWHCGDVGNLKIADELASIAKLRCVAGNIDGGDVVQTFGYEQSFNIDGCPIGLLHIGGYPGRYSKQAEQFVKKHSPKILCCGHSHILKIMYDKTNELLYINPGAAGKYGFHNRITAVRFLLIDGVPKDMEVLDVEKHTGL
jgi:putative phosphoesterase